VVAAAETRAVSQPDAAARAGHRQLLFPERTGGAPAAGDAGAAPLFAAPRWPPLAMERTRAGAG